jgi:hypothetical protein
VPSPTPTPPLNDTLAWLTAEDITWLTTSAEASNPVCSIATQYADNNNVGLSNPRVKILEAIYPFEYRMGDRRVQVSVHIARNSEIFLIGVWNQDQVNLDVNSSSYMQILK